MKKNIIPIIFAMLIVAIPVSSQVTMGSQKIPEKFSLLELISNSQRGLRLPQLNTLQRTELEQSADFQNQKSGLAKGLTIFNTDTNCMETWNGSQWISLCAEGTIATLGCASITGVNVTQGIAANVTASLPYSGMTGANIDLADGTVLGTISGLSVVVDGAQTLVAPSGNVAIKITGTAAVSGAINIPVSLAGASCEITVTSAVNPATLSTGYGTFTGRTCFDVVMTNDGDDCGTLAGRKSQKADFTLSSINTQVYTFTASGNVSNVRFYVSDTSRQVVQSYTPASYPGTTNNGATRTVTVNYYTDLNQKASGLSRSNALTAILYVVYTDGTGIDRMLKLQVSVQDCSCCPGYLSTKGEYIQTASSLSFAAGDNFATVSASFKATGKDVCFFMADYPGGTMTYSSADSYCTSGFANLAPYAYMGWRVPNIAELGYISNVALSLSNQPASVAGTTNMVTTPAGGGSGDAYYVSSSKSSTGVTYGWSYGYDGVQMVSVAANARCVRTQ